MKVRRGDGPSAKGREERQIGRTLTGTHGERQKMGKWSIGVERVEWVWYNTGAMNGIERALEANRVAYETLRERLRVGMTERDAYELVRMAVDGVCGDEPHEFIGDFVGGVRSGAIEGPATDSAFKSGDAFILDLSVRRGETWSDTCRTFFFGEPTEAQRRAYETVIACQELGEKTVRAGIVCSDVKRAVEQFLVSKGLGGKMPHHVGHLVGPKPYYKPAFELGCDEKLPEGVFCTLEPGLYFEGDFGIRVENDYLVGAEGLKNLFDYPRDLESFIL